MIPVPDPIPESKIPSIARRNEAIRIQKRDQFAMAALTGLLAGSQPSYRTSTVKEAFEYADECMRERDAVEPRVQILSQGDVENRRRQMGKERENG